MHIQFLRYLFVGGSSAVVDLLVYTILLTYLSVWYPIAAFFGYMVGLTWNYVISLVWVFESRHNRMAEMVMVFAIAIGGLLWTWLILYILITLMGMDAVIAKMMSQIVVLAWNFGMRKFYVFH
jgi:putative flippase GtrA